MGSHAQVALSGQIIQINSQEPWVGWGGGEGTKKIARRRTSTESIE
jgi:hypothetical protein